MSDFESVKPYTQAELDQQAIWANEFDQWWENEGQYQRAGGGQYERSFAWWAWLDREQSKQAIIDQLNSVLEERTKEWLQAIELGTYFENVAKPLKEENDRLKAQLNNMEACYIEKKKEVEDQQERIDAGLEKIHQFGKEGCLFPEWLTWAEKALRGAND